MENKIVADPSLIEKVRASQGSTELCDAAGATVAVARLADRQGIGQQVLLKPVDGGRERIAVAGFAGPHVLALEPLDHRHRPDESVGHARSRSARPRAASRSRTWVVVST